MESSSGEKVGPTRRNFCRNKSKNWKGAGSVCKIKQAVKEKRCSPEDKTKNFILMCQVGFVLWDGERLRMRHGLVPSESRFFITKCQGRLRGIKMDRHSQQRRHMEENMTITSGAGGLERNKWNGTGHTISFLLQCNTQKY